MNIKQLKEEKDGEREIVLRGEGSYRDPHKLVCGL